ncbi:hypothetical protein ISCGN_007960 [Ixodes scapularis]
MDDIGERKRCLVEGEDVLNCDHVIECSVAPEPTTDGVRIVAYVLQPSTLHIPDSKAFFEHCGTQQGLTISLQTNMRHALGECWCRSCLPHSECLW